MRTYGRVGTAATARQVNIFDLRWLSGPHAAIPTAISMPSLHGSARCRGNALHGTHTEGLRRDPASSG
jgi:hypothetical protein